MLPLASTRAIWSCTIWNVPSGNISAKLLQIGADGRGVGEQSIGRDQRGHGGKQREQAEEHHAGRNREQAVFADLLIGAPQDIFPAGPGDLQWIA